MKKYYFTMKLMYILMLLPMISVASGKTLVRRYICVARLVLAYSHAIVRSICVFLLRHTSLEENITG